MPARCSSSAYDPDSEKWWLPGRDVAPCTHPDDTAKAVLDEMDGLDAGEPAFDHVESFRGRRGWHLAFHDPGEGDGNADGRHPVAVVIVRQPSSHGPRRMGESHRRQADRLIARRVMPVAVRQTATVA
ncbi:MAG: hypothetical protein GDA49_09850 [Rhodospirillales bacterium]|nr:hypothetical protein [Rhodospirillales bacterium]